MGGNKYDQDVGAPVTPEAPLPSIKVIWEEGGGHIHCDVFQGKGEGYTWERCGLLVFDSAGFKAFTECMMGKGLFILEGKKHAKAKVHPPMPKSGEMDTAPCIKCGKGQAEHEDKQYCETVLDGDDAPKLDPKNFYPLAKEIDLPEGWITTRRGNGLFEAVCPHGVGHPDASRTEMKYYYGIHGCDGCCSLLV